MNQIIIFKDPEIYNSINIYVEQVLSQERVDQMITVMKKLYFTIMYIAQHQNKVLQDYGVNLTGNESEIFYDLKSKDIDAFK